VKTWCCTLGAGSAVALAILASCGSRLPSNAGPKASPAPRGSESAQASASASAAPTSADGPATPLAAQYPWSPNGNRLLFGSGVADLVTKMFTPFACRWPAWVSDRFVLCDSATGVPVTSLDVETGVVRQWPCTEHMESGWEHYAVCTEGGVNVYDLATGDIVSIPSAARVVHFAPHRVLEVIGVDTIQLWDFDKNGPIGGPFSMPSIGRLLTSRDAQWSVSVDYTTGTGRLVDRRDGHVTELPKDGVPWPVLGFSDEYFDHAGDRLAIPVKAGGVRVFDPNGAKALFVLSSPKCPAPFGIAWSADDKLLATSGSAGTVCVFDVARRSLVSAFTVRVGQRSQLPRPPGAPPPEPTPDPANVVLLAFVPDGTALIAGEDEPMGPGGCGHGGIYRTASGEALGDLGVICGSGYATANGEWIVGWERMTLVTRDLRRVPLGQMNASISPDGHLVVDGATFGAVEGAHRPVLQNADGASLLRFDPSGTKILGTVGESPRVWSAVTGELLASFP
jgi:WD40 repeat protein